MVITIHAEPDPDRDIYVDALISQILAEFRSSVITATDTYEAQRVRFLATEAELEREGTPIRNPEMFLSDIESRRVRFGPGKEVLISDDGRVTIGGRIVARQIWLQAIRDEPGQMDERLLVFLRSQNIGRVSCSWE